MMTQDTPHTTSLQHAEEDAPMPSPGDTTLFESEKNSRGELEKSFSRFEKIRHRGQRVYGEETFERLRMPRAPHWSVVWSDLMMTMFILFTVMYLYQLEHKEFIVGKESASTVGGEVSVMGTIGPAEEPVDRRLARIYRLSRQLLTEEQMAGFASVDLAPDKTVRFVLTGDLLFDSGEADIKPRARQTLSRFIPLIRSTPSMINVVGHTDDVPIHTDAYPSNWELSLARASTVARYLIEETGLPPERFAVSGYASYQPLFPNDSPAHRAANRRVEIILSRDRPAAVTPEVINEE